mmetsp:Transcript_32685/g.109102  ORF Transcript_32685/g.109102 Transcript_32685/m.109102 type:complete len:371 (-) Transcript_32685:224-1336(-)
MMRILARRMAEAAVQFVSSPQTGFVPDAFIGENIMFLELVQSYLEEEDEDGYFLFLDMESPLSRKGQAGVRGVEQLPQPHVEGVHRLPVGRLHRSGLARHGPRRAHRRDGDSCAARTREPRTPPCRRGGGDAECGGRRRERSAEQSGREREDPRLADADREGSDAVPRVAGHVWHVFDEGDDGAEQCEEGDRAGAAPGLQRRRRHRRAVRLRRVRKEAPVDECAAHRHDAERGQEGRTLEANWWAGVGGAEEGRAAQRRAQRRAAQRWGGPAEGEAAGEAEQHRGCANGRRHLAGGEGQGGLVDAVDGDVEELVEPGDVHVDEQGGHHRVQHQRHEHCTRDGGAGRSGVQRECGDAQGGADEGVRPREAP